MDYVRSYYDVPAKRGMRVSYSCPTMGEQHGVITRATHYVYVRFDGMRHSRPFHPTEPRLKYLVPSSRPGAAS